MSKMLIAEGTNEEAVQLLTPIYESFEDKSATEDLKRSARLLAAATTNRPSIPLESERSHCNCFGRLSSIRKG
jgi:hypothetical protein